MDARVGVIGWNYPEWRGLVYPSDARAGDFLRLYAQRFPIVEVAASYYKFPTLETIESWARDAPAGFAMSMKVPDWITKTPTDPEVPRRVAWFLERVAPLRKAGRLGALVAQFPPFFHRDKREPELRAFVEGLPADHEWAVELRHDSWWREETYSLLARHDITLAWSHTETARTPPVRTTARVYARLFGDRELKPPYDRKRRDRTALLAEWADALKASGAKRADVLVSKYLEGYAPGSVATMDALLDLPAPDVGAPRQVTKQATLF